MSTSSPRSGVSGVYIELTILEWPCLWKRSLIIFPTVLTELCLGLAITIIVAASSIALSLLPFPAAIISSYADDIQISSLDILPSYLEESILLESSKSSVEVPSETSASSSLESAPSSSWPK